MDKTRRAAIYMRVARAPRAWIYCRTAEPNAFALKIQQEELTAFAEKNHYDIVGCTSRHEAGTTMTRPGLAEITNAALQGKMDILLVLNDDVLQNDQHLIVLVDGVHAVIESDEPAPHRREHNVCKPSGLDIISAQSG